MLAKQFSALLLPIVLMLSACAEVPQETKPVWNEPPEYRALQDGDTLIPAVNPAYLNERNMRKWVEYDGPEPVGSIVVDPYARVLYHVYKPGLAMRFGIAVGRQGKGFSGNGVIRRKEEYPSWTPTKNMIRTEPEIYAALSGGLPGGLDNPLGARALYLYRNGKDTMYRIHGTMDPSSIGKATSAGCIRLFNQDIVDMFDEVPLGTTVKVRSQAESLMMEGPMIELPSGYLIPEAQATPEQLTAAGIEGGIAKEYNPAMPLMSTAAN